MKKDVSESMSITSLVASAADQYVSGLARGEAPDVGEIALRFPQVASVLPQVLPTLQLIQSLVAGDRFTAALRSEPAILGDFHLLHEIGRGGMGVVYEAEQISSGRRVAVKVLSHIGGTDARQLARFHIETQVASTLQHPHIVPILEVGHDLGLHYYAMKLIEGCSLATILWEPTGAVGSEANSRTADCPTSPKPLLPREAARLAMLAARALGHAHSLGVVHRDVKPANLLVDHGGHLWVTDFGLARFGGGSGLTETGDLLGTVRYMSPEQAAGGGIVDARTDIYSLGVTLYELLTGTPAFAGAIGQDLIRQISSVEPADPRELEPSIPPDLETICLKAMAKEPERRYATVLELADDLKRFLDDQPITARRPGVVERVARWSRRHRRATTMAAGFAFVMALAGAGGMTALWHEHGLTRLALHKAREAQISERAALKFTFAASDQITSRALALIANRNRSTDQSGDQDFCRKALEYYEEITARYDNDPEMAMIAAAAGHRVGFLRMIVKDERAEQALRRSIAIYERLRATNPHGREVLVGLALAWNDMAVLVRGRGDHAALIECARELVATRTRLAADFPSDSDNLISLTYYQTELCELYAQAGHAELAAECGRQLRASYPVALAATPGDHRVRNVVAWHLVERTTGLEDARSAVKLATRATALAPDQGAYWNTLGVAQYRAGDYRGALVALEQSMCLRCGGDPYDWIFVAMVHARLGDLAQARAWYDRSQAWIEAHPNAQAGLVRLFDEFAGCRPASPARS